MNKVEFLNGFNAFCAGGLATSLFLDINSYEWKISISLLVLSLTLKDILQCK